LPMAHPREMVPDQPTREATPPGEMTGRCLCADKLAGLKSDPSMNPRLSHLGGSFAAHI